MTPDEFTERIGQVRTLARELLAKHNLHDWTFAFNRRKRAMGLCLDHLRTIELSVYFVVRNSQEEILDTLLHEIAHALAGAGHGHDEVWKRKCLEIGAKPERCGEAEMPIGRWRAQCGRCGRNFHRHRRPKKSGRWFCRACGPELGNLAWKLGA